MRGPAVLCLIAVLDSSAWVADAQERSAPAGAVTVRPVRVREVRTEPPPAREEQRPSTGVERPLELALISRPGPRPSPNVTSTLPSTEHSRGHSSSRSRPRVVGYPVIYPYAYPADPFSPTPMVIESAPPARNTYSSADSMTGGAITGGPPRAGAVACDGAAPCGGLSFDVRPASAQVLVDGEFVGTVSEFDDPAAPLLLAPGEHYIEVRLAGHRTAAFDVTLAPGDVTSYQGVLDRLRLRRP